MSYVPSPAVHNRLDVHVVSQGEETRIGEPRGRRRRPDRGRAEGDRGGAGEVPRAGRALLLLRKRDGQDGHGALGVNIVYVRRTWLTGVAPPGRSIGWCVGLR